MTRYADQGFDGRIADWLEADPVTAPPDLFRTVEAALPSISQRRTWRLPWRFSPMPRFAILAAAALVAIAALGVAAIGSQRPQPDPVPVQPVPSTPAATAAPVPTETPAPTESPLPMLGGQILLEHFGNSIDGTEASPDVNPQRRRLYLIDPNNMTASGATEFLPGEPATGKYSADVSPDGSQVAFMDYTPFSSIYVANIDGTGFRKLTPKGCGCSQWDPAFDPTGTKVVYGTRDGTASWLEILDLATGKTTEVKDTRGPSKDLVPEAPSWSPDGTHIVFVRFAWGDREATMGRIHYWQGNPDQALLQVATVDGGNVATIPTPDLVPGDPHWSPDGSTILFTNAPMTIMGGDGENHSVWLVAADGSDLRTVVDTTGGVRQIMSSDSATWTPDGRITLGGDHWELISPDGTGHRRIDPGSMDTTDGPTGYVYVIHWVGTP